MTTTLPAEEKRKKVIIFDLDGTLVDIEPVFLKIVNILAEEFHFSPIHPEEIPRLKKFHLKSLLWKYLGWRIIFLPKILKRGREEYRKIAPTVSLFPGMKTLLETLHSHGYRIGIVSSSQREIIEIIMIHFKLPIDFLYHGTLFNKSESIKKAIEEEKCILDETVYIGDEVRDVEACQKIGLDIISVSWGLNDKEALQNSGHQIIVDQPSKLLEILLHT